MRKKSYKIGVDADKSRFRKGDTLIEIRKNKRNYKLLKKRCGQLNGLPFQPPHDVCQFQAVALNSLVNQEQFQPHPINTYIVPLKSSGGSTNGTPQVSNLQNNTQPVVVFHIILEYWKKDV
ncbi:hypothetical protein LIER_28448 [Lithospermum erythrorhizon]|uniref:IBB domain-containing protein n=1 Tax=Lithospermum erythrorhizon TaxID=34254 RepID=A0AAV3RG34_LITER